METLNPVITQDNSATEPVKSTRHSAPIPTPILDIRASERLDSRGNPTVQVVVTTRHGRFKAIVPSGASTGKHEAVELRDGKVTWDDKEKGNAKRYHGKGVRQAVKNVNADIWKMLKLTKLVLPDDVESIDGIMIQLGGKNKSGLGANAILGVSMAVWRAAAAAEGVPLYEFIAGRAKAKQPYVMPVPFFNVLNGGAHSGSKMAFQEIMIAPVGAESLTEAVRMGSEVYQELKKVVEDKWGSSATGIGDEGGFAPPELNSATEALDLITAAVARCKYVDKVKFAIDAAASEFYDEESNTYDPGPKRSKAVAPENERTDEKRGPIPKTRGESSYSQMTRIYAEDLLEKYPVVLLEDPFAQDDLALWRKFNRVERKNINDDILSVVGDDLLVTNVERIDTAYGKGEEDQACNALLLKINQIGTISEAIKAAKKAYDYDWSVFVSHRSGETTDDFIADLTVGLRAGHLKAGAPCRGERVAKYNRLMDIEEELKLRGNKPLYAGERFRQAWTM